MTARIPLSRGYESRIDDADAERVMAAGPWHAAVDGRTVYAQRNVKRADGSWTKQMLHAFLTGWPETDHINGDGLDNRRANLRQVSHAQNMANQRRPKNNTSGYKGVCRAKDRWRARLKVDGRDVHVGYFDTAEAAARGYDAAARTAWGDFARLNFPEEATAL